MVISFFLLSRVYQAVFERVDDTVLILDDEDAGLFLLIPPGSAMQGQNVFRTLFLKRKLIELILPP